MYKQTLTWLAIGSLLVALLLTGVGGWSDLVGRPLVVSKQHAWNDGLFLMLVGIFLLLLARA
jgi:hypothetical protein